MSNDSARIAKKTNALNNQQQIAVQMIDYLATLFSREFSSDDFCART